MGGAVLVLACSSKLAALYRGATPPPVATAAAPPARIDWTPGHRYEYGFKVASMATLAAGSSSELGLAGHLVLVSRDLGAGAREVSVDVDDVRRESAPAPAVDAVISHLRQPFTFTLERGRIVGFRVAYSDAEAANVLRTIASTLQCADPAADEKTWTAEEYDSTGKYVAEYTRTSETSISKRKLRYESLILGGGSLTFLNDAKPKPDVRSSEGSFVRRGPTIEHLELVDELALPFQSTTVVSKSQISLDLIGERGDAAVDWSALEAKTRPLRAEEPYVGPPRPTAAFDKERIGDFTYDTALVALEKVARETHRPSRGKHPSDASGDRTDQIRDSQRAFIAMSAILRSQPGHIAGAEQVAKGRSDIADWMADALGSAGTDDAQAALLEVIQDPNLKLEHRFSAARSLIRTEEASDATIDWLIRSENDPTFREVAIFGLGSAARRLEIAGRPDRAGRAIDELMRLLSDASNNAEKILALEGIGNAGDSRGFEPVQRLLDDPDPTIRAASLEALRLMKDPRVDGLVADHMKDRDVDVRLSALTAVKARNPSDVLASELKELMLSDAKTSVRGKAVRIAKTWLGRRPELRSVLETVATRDENANLRSVAKDALGS